jgi:hypothetical protein
MYCLLQVINVFSHALHLFFFFSTGLLRTSIYIPLNDNPVMRPQFIRAHSKGHKSSKLPTGFDHINIHKRYDKNKSHDVL